jgi:hypothetical protein
VAVKFRSFVVLVVRDGITSSGLINLINRAVNMANGFAQKVAFSESAFSGRLKIARRFIAGIGRSSRRSP